MKYSIFYFLVIGFIFFIFSTVESSLIKVKRTLVEITDTEINLEVVLWKNNHFILIDEEPWFSKRDYYRFSETMIHPALQNQNDISVVCILNDETGVLTEECLKNPHIKKIYVIRSSEVIADFLHTRKILDLTLLSKMKSRVIRKNNIQEVFKAENSIDVLYVNQKWDEMKKTIWDININKQFPRIHSMVLNCFSGYFDTDKYQDILQLVERNYRMCYYQVAVPSVCDNLFAFAYRKNLSQENYRKLPEKLKFLSENCLKEIQIIDRDIQEKLEKMNVYHTQGGLF